MGETVPEGVSGTLDCEAEDEADDDGELVPVLDAVAEVVTVPDVVPEGVPVVDAVPVEAAVPLRLGVCDCEVLRDPEGLLVPVRVPEAAMDRDRVPVLVLV